MGGSGSNGGDVIEVTGSEIGEQPALSSTVDPRILGTYDGDGSQHALSQTKSVRAVRNIVSLSIIWSGLAFFVLLVPAYVWDVQNSFEDIIRQASLFSGIVWLAVFVTEVTIYRHYFRAIFLGANDQQASYWQRNQALRRNARSPHNKDEFAALISLATAADYKLALTHVAGKTEAYYNRLIDERGLNSVRLIRGSLLNQIIRQDPGQDNYEPEEM